MSGCVTAAALLGIAAPNAERSVVAVVGCGGKTTLIGAIAGELAHKRGLITPTAKILPMRADGVSLCETLAQAQNHAPHIGVQCMGILNKDSGKLGPLPTDALKELTLRYDAALLEADGSRMLPCKGWRDDEPVVPNFCTHTIGVVTLQALGMPADGNTVLRLNEFLRLTGLTEGEPITEEAFLRMVCGKEGMFRHSAGERYLFVNQAEGKAAQVAESWLMLLKSRYPGYFCRTAYGSAKNNAWKEV